MGPNQTMLAASGPGRPCLRPSPRDPGAAVRLTPAVTAAQVARVQEQLHARAALNPAAAPAAPALSLRSTVIIITIIIDITGIIILLFLVTS